MFRRWTARKRTGSILAPPLPLCLSQFALPRRGGWAAVLRELPRLGRFGHLGRRGEHVVCAFADVLSFSLVDHVLAFSFGF
jgi:hypothetical protein